ncbi:MAG: alpha/beta fold hydrolase [Candidatus Aenigmarchaeota archaeon]|nr:alpha/beta fold hydrolase [Candidatus Aenigmarchaeota archaeon]
MQEAQFVNNRGEKLAGIFCRTEKEKAPCVIICHGLGSSKDNKEPLMKAFSEGGLASMAFDFSGHGESQGSFEKLTVTNAVADSKAAIDYVSSLASVDANRIGIMGHSFGGSVSLLAATIDKRIKSIVASAPVTDFNETLTLLADFDTRMGNLAVWKAKGYTHYLSYDQKYLKLGYTFLEDVMKYDAKNLAKKIKCPVLLIHGNKDKIVPMHQSEKMLNLLSCEKDLKKLECGHYFEEQDLKNLIEFSQNWFIKWLS